MNSINAIGYGVVGMDLNTVVGPATFDKQHDGKLVNISMDVIPDGSADVVNAPIMRVTRVLTLDSQNASNNVRMLVRLTVTLPALGISTGSAGVASSYALSGKEHTMTVHTVVTLPRDVANALALKSPVPLAGLVRGFYAMQVMKALGLVTSVISNGALSPYVSGTTPSTGSGFNLLVENVADQVTGPEAPLGRLLTGLDLLSDSSIPPIN
uniref:Uncharacterized protein n=1 Tax=Vansystermes virus TaxID=2796636 RepID=A0A7T7GUY4_9VIRU|nr:hypothetical protein 2 [Vansystermes virus]